MFTPLCFSGSSVAIQVGDLIENFGAIAVVEAIDNQRGLLCKIVNCEVGGKKQGGVGQRFYANPDLCKPAPLNIWLSHFSDKPK